MSHKSAGDIHTLFGEPVTASVYLNRKPPGSSPFSEDIVEIVLSIDRSEDHGDPNEMVDYLADNGPWEQCRCRCGNYHDKPFGDLNADIIQLSCDHAIALAHEILRLATEPTEAATPICVHCCPVHCPPADSEADTDTDE